MATIIKRELHQHASGTSLRGTAYNLVDMAGRADEYLDQVRQEAAKIVAEAEQEATSIRMQAQEDGRAEAEAAVDRLLNEKVAEQMGSLRPALESAVRQIEDARQDWMRHWEQSAVALASAIAGRIVRKQLGEAPEISMEWIREALQMTAGSSQVVVRLNPNDLEALRAQIEQVVGAFRPLASARLEPDESISPGGCRVETEFGSVDQQLETQLDRIAEELG